VTMSVSSRRLPFIYSGFICGLLNRSTDVLQSPYGTERHDALSSA
jgi:hypothetical protein